MDVAVVVPHVCGETSNTAFHVVANRLIILALFHNVL